MTASSSFTLPDDAHAVIREGHAWWQSLAPAPGRLPGRQHVDPMAIPKLLPFLWLLDVHLDDDGLRLRYRLVGSHIDLGFGLSKTGRWLDEVEPSFARDPVMQAPYLALVQQRQPSYRKGAPRFAHNSAVTMLERLLLPLAPDGLHVDMVLGFTVFYDGDGQIIRASP